jgi:hypothetical protein
MSPFLARLLVRLGVLRPDKLRVGVSAAPLRIDVSLLVHSTSNEPRPVTFRVDSGCSVSTISVDLARSLGLPLPRQRARVRRITAAGLIEVEVLRGDFRFWLTEDQRAAPFVAPIDFQDNQPPDIPALLGLKGVINQVRWPFDGRFRPNEPNGFCILQDQRPAAQRYPS